MVVRHRCQVDMAHSIATPVANAQVSKLPKGSFLWNISEPRQTDCCCDSVEADEDAEDFLQLIGVEGMDAGTGSCQWR